MTNTITNNMISVNSVLNKLKDALKLIKKENYDYVYDSDDEDNNGTVTSSI